MWRVRSLIFNLAFYSWNFLYCLYLSPSLLLPQRQTVAVVRFYFNSVGWLERVIGGIHYTLEGADYIPKAGPYLVAMKHQSAWETLKLFTFFGYPAIVHKRELLWLPLWGWYLAKLKMISINRGAGSAAMHSLMSGAKRCANEGRPIVIFPQGTRIPVGEKRPYKYGIAALYQDLNLPVIPVALNSGKYWPRNSFWKRPGVIKVQVLPPIAPGLPPAEFLKQLENTIETASNAL